MANTAKASSELFLFKGIRKGEFRSFEFHLARVRIRESPPRPSGRGGLAPVTHPDGRTGRPTPRRAGRGGSATRRGAGKDAACAALPCGLLRLLYPPGGLERTTAHQECHLSQSQGREPSRASGLTLGATSTPFPAPKERHDLDYFPNLTLRRLTRRLSQHPRSPLRDLSYPAFVYLGHGYAAPPVHGVRAAPPALMRILGAPADSGHTGVRPTPAHRPTLRRETVRQTL